MSFTNKKLIKFNFWPNDPRDGCKPPPNLIKLVQTYLSFEEELKEFEGSFEQDEIMDI
jgi:hypothetical protein